MEQQDDESLESLQACVENFVLPQEMIIEVEGEDAGSLDIMPQESTDFKIVTVDLTEEGQSMWNNAQRTPEKTVILEGHRDLWDLPAVHGTEGATAKQTIFNEEPSHGLKLEGSARDDPWLSTCEEVRDCKEQSGKQPNKQEEVAFTQGSAGSPDTVYRGHDPDRSCLSTSRPSFPMIPLRNHFHKQASHVKKLHGDVVASSHQKISDSSDLLEDDTAGAVPQSIRPSQFVSSPQGEEAYELNGHVQASGRGAPRNLNEKVPLEGKTFGFKGRGQVLNHSVVLGGQQELLVKEGQDKCKTAPSPSLPQSLRNYSEEKRFECKYCGKSFSWSSHLIAHQRTHTGEKPYNCQECGKAFRERSALTKHEIIHSGIKPYECNKCGKSCSQMAHLVRHQRTHTGEKPYECNKCGKSFSQSCHLVAHRRIHTGEKPYKCNQCERSFNCSSHLIAHRRTHTGEKRCE